MDFAGRQFVKANVTDCFKLHLLISELLYLQDFSVVSDMYKLMTACMCAMAGDAQVGRVFACLHQMKPWLGTHIPTEQLNQFITVGSSNMPIDTFPFSIAIARFMQRYVTNE